MRITEPRTRRGALTALSTLGETYREGAATPAPLEHKPWIGGIDCGGIDNSCTRLGEEPEKRELRINSPPHAGLAQASGGRAFGYPKQ